MRLREPLYEDRRSLRANKQPMIRIRDTYRKHHGTHTYSQVMPSHPTAKKELKTNSRTADTI